MVRPPARRWLLSRVRPQCRQCGCCSWPQVVRECSAHSTSRTLTCNHSPVIEYLHRVRLLEVSAVFFLRTTPTAGHNRIEPLELFSFPSCSLARSVAVHYSHALIQSTSCCNQPTYQRLVRAPCFALQAEEEFVHPPHYPWEHRKSYFSTYDHASIRRGYEVYRQVCAACHSLDRIAFRNLQVRPELSVNFFFRLPLSWLTNIPWVSWIRGPTSCAGCSSFFS